ncbi:hypothetical protein K0C01_01200 [Salinarchaeum sp. IM2453]|uniref:DUF7310 family coiled-coil domain-containing protein n=1 Tax=Salinarchaeum sp. IM2453 TaxID=2862870 RepID=UPI001C83F513|nr:hypothetical protein [Salinarchaeum sp. IM2453]QZA88812.1 hypothetical protein K0C01_01200 [Salinarchaeum sp. IM2453]
MGCNNTSEFNQTGTAETTDKDAEIQRLEKRVAELEATVQSFESYISHIEETDGVVERRANVALAAVDRLEKRVNTIESELEQDTQITEPNQSYSTSPPQEDKTESQFDAVLGNSGSSRETADIIKRIQGKL